jgi:hypothetical protein
MIRKRGRDRRVIRPRDPPPSGWERISGRIGIRTAFGIELAAAVVVVLSCSTPPAYTSSYEGQVTFSDVVMYVDEQPFYLADAQVLPTVGQRVLVVYQDSTWDRIVLSVTVDPDTPGSVIYTTEAGRFYEQWLWLSRLAVCGLVVGLVVGLIAAVQLVMLSRRAGSPAYGVCAAIAPLTPLGGVALVGVNLQPTANPYVLLASLVIWLVATVGTLVAGGVGRRRDEAKLAVAKIGQALALGASALWVVGWIGFLSWIVTHFGPHAI